MKKDVLIPPSNDVHDAGRTECTIAFPSLLWPVKYVVGLGRSVASCADEVACGFVSSLGDVIFGKVSKS